MTVQVPKFGQPRVPVRVNPRATEGAVFGENLWVREGGSLRLLVAADVLGTASGESFSPTSWALILNVPAPVQALAGFAGTGLYAVTGAGTSAGREIEGTAGEIDVANGTGVSGNPVVSLADLADGGGGALLKFTRDAKGRVSGTSAASTSDLSEGSNLYFTTARVQEAPLPSYTVGTLPTPTAGLLIYVTDESGGAVPAFGDGTNFRRVTDRAIVT